VTAREYPEQPVAGVGAVIIQDSRVLLIRRGHAPMQGEWSLPGGALEVGETLEEGVRREVLEETGLHVKPVVMVEVFDRIARDSTGRVQYHYVLVDFLCKVTGGIAACGSDAIGLRWAALGELNEVASFTREVIKKAWAMYKQEP
jgi:8-oxo-dGTP diphosphatase